MRRQAANALTLLRLVLAPLLAWCIVANGDSAGIAVVLFAFAALSDVTDGWLARRLGAATRVGRWLDHLADIALLVGAFSAYTWRGVAPWWVPASIAAAFGFYVIDSLRRSRQPTLIGSRMGHVGGILNYVILGTLVVNDELGVLATDGIVVRALLCLVPLYSAASVAARLVRR
jgi:CDP-diacylglycerol--glycerol-3-phosphate 3-phosphatidyltransferase